MKPAPSPTKNQTADGGFRSHAIPERAAEREAQLQREVDEKGPRTLGATTNARNSSPRW